MTATLIPTEPTPEPLQHAWYFYDGDGNMVKGIINSITTYYPGRYYNKEVTTAGTKVQKFYFALGMTIAIRTIQSGTDELKWVLSDHLGSASMTANQDGTWNSTIQYTAYGEIRLTKGIAPTKYRYTGQLAQAELGLDFYVARFYDPILGHFTQADTIVPEPGKASAFDRYSSVQNNPIRYNDPSGHKPCDGPGLNGKCDQAEKKWKNPLPPPLIINQKAPSPTNVQPELPVLPETKRNGPFIGPGSKIENPSKRINSFEFFHPLRVDQLNGFGFSIAYSGFVIPVLGGQFSGDIYYDFIRNDLLIGFTPNVLGGFGGGGSLTGGVDFLYGSNSAMEYAGPSFGGQASLINEVGVSGSWSATKDRNISDRNPQIYQIAVGAGVEGSLTGTGSFTIPIIYWDFNKPSFAGLEFAPHIR
jgi:RHS repeat-associated protein